MSASLTPSPKMQFFTVNGDPLAGGKLYTYAAGTTTPLATYTDSTGGTPNANPVIMNARGEASVWLGTSSYYLELKDSEDSLIWTADNITGQITSSQVQSGSYQWLTSVSGVDTITAVASPTPTSYSAGQSFKFVSAGANTGAVTLNISGLGAKEITKNGTTALVAGDIPSGAVVEVTYDGTRFQLINVKVSLAGLAASGANSDITSLTGIAGPINEAEGSNIASASSINLTTATGNYVHVTGTTAITAITLAQGVERTVVFDGALTLTNGASLILPSGANITTAAGDCATFRGEASSVVRCVMYTKASGGTLLSYVPTDVSGGVGTISWLKNTSGSTVSGLGTVAGTGLQWVTTGSTVVDGTWRLLEGSGIPTGSSGNFQRIA